MTFKKYIYISAVALGLLTAGAITPTTHASHIYSMKTTAVHHANKDTVGAYLQYHHGVLTPNPGRSDNASTGLSAPYSDGRYNEYLNGRYNIWSKPARHYHGHYINQGVMITDKAGSRRLALERVPFKGIHGSRDVANMEIANRDFVGWINPNGLYGYDGSEGKLPIRYTTKHHVIRHNYRIVKRNHKHAIRRLTKKHNHKVNINNKKRIHKHLTKFQKNNKRTYRNHKTTKKSRF